MGKLEDAEFRYLMVDDQIKHRGNFITELRRLEEGRGT